MIHSFLPALTWLRLAGLALAIGQEELIEEYPLAVGRETAESNRRPGDRSAPTGPPRRIGVGPVMSAFDDSTVLVTVAAVAALVAVNVCEELTWPLPPVVFWSTVFTVAAVFFHALAAVAAWYNDEAGSAVSLGEAVEATRLKLTPAKFCSACCKESDALRLCNGCKGVWYCDEGCQKNHRDEHVTDCERIKTELDKRGGKLDLSEELDVGPLEKLAPREECPICMHAMPLHNSSHTYFACCSKTICGGCHLQHQMTSGERPLSCAFCRTAVPGSDEEILVQLRKRVELKDPHALCDMALYYGDGDLGLPVDHAKCIELLREAADLGFPSALHHFGNFHRKGDKGLERNEAEAFKYYKEAAEGGDVESRHNLGCVEEGSGDHVAAMHHWRLAASGGFRKSMNVLIECFEDGLLRHGNLAETLQAFNNARAEMKSKDRDQYIKHLKETGESCEEFDL